MILYFSEEVLKKVSVIIPFYKQSEYICDAVESVLNSTYKNIEIIVVNDGSPDISPDALREMLPVNIKIINQKNYGVCKARNVGIDSATGEYILPLDADDKIAPLYIEKAVKILDTKPEIGIVCSEVEAFGVKSGKINQKPATVENMLVQNRIFPCAMFRKTDFQKTDGYRDAMLTGCEDWDLWLSIMENGLKTFKIPEVLFYYRKNENIRTAKALQFSNYVKIRKNIIKFHKNLYKKYFMRVCLPLLFMIVKNLGFNLLNGIKYLKKFVRRLLLKTLINIGGYKSIKRIDKKKIQREIDIFSENGTDENSDIIISLTSIPERMHDIHFTLYSLLNQGTKPKKVVLYLGQDKFKNIELPENVKKLKKNGLEIKYTEDVRSFTKLIPALDDFKDNIIVTADDDIFYEKDWLKNLVETHNKYPKDIIVHKPMQITFDKDKNPKPYKTWSKSAQGANFKNFIMGVGGVLYPVNSLYSDVKDRTLFLRLCPHNDDVWFWAMAVMNGTKIRVADNFMAQQTLVNPERELNLNSEPTLYKGNRINRTDLQFRNVWNYYGEIREKVYAEKD